MTRDARGDTLRWNSFLRNQPEICINRRIFTAMIVLALVVVGAASYLRLGQDRFPGGRSNDRRCADGAAHCTEGKSVLAR